jgi:hypothetical protein
LVNDPIKFSTKFLYFRWETLYLQSEEGGKRKRFIVKVMMALLVTSMLTLAMNNKLVNAEISANVEFPIAVLNLKSIGRLVCCYIELPEGYSVMDINV